MGLGIVRRYTAVAAVLLGGFLVTGSARSADTPDACDISSSRPTVTTAYNKAAWDAFRAAETVNKQPHDDAAALKAANVIALGDVVTVTGENFAKFFDKSCAPKQVVLFFNGLPMAGITPKPPTDPAGTELNFTLTRSNAAPNTWLPILGSPAGSRKVTVSVGFSDGFAMGSMSGPLPELEFNIVPRGRFVAWVIVLMLLVILFVFCAKRSNIIRDPSPALDGTRGTYSLSRTQAAWWFFVILATYLFIGIVTGDYSDSFNGTALALIGIGAGTMIGSATVDAQKDTAKSKTDILAAIAGVTTKLQAATGDEKTALESQLKKLKGETENFLTDILSDANGISSHRFQIFAWTLVLSIIFMVDVYTNLAMPTFNQTLLGLLGLSAGTYVGLKIPEATTPTK